MAAAEGQLDPATTEWLYEQFSGVLESEDVDDVDCNNAEGEWVEVDVVAAADSGCGDHVMSREHCPGYAVQESRASRAGKGFIAAGGDKILNEGEACLNLSAGKRQISSTFQIARVTRPLMSVGKICDAGHEVTFTKVCAIVRDLRGREVCRFARKGGLYLINFKLRAPKSSTGFGRQGSRQ